LSPGSAPGFLEGNFLRWDLTIWNEVRLILRRLAGPNPSKASPTTLIVPTTPTNTEITSGGGVRLGLRLSSWKNCRDGEAPNR
jgi:hypothetical protein